MTSEKNSAFYLVGLLNEFMNNFQAAGDQFFEEISWKQCFVLICIQLFQAPPTIRKIAELQGSSHQNIKQMLLKLERSGYIYFIKDEKDLRKQRIQITEKTKQFSQKYDKASTVYMEELFAPVSREELKITIETISKLDGQLRKIRESRNERGKQGISEEQFYQLKKRTVL